MHDLPSELPLKLQLASLELKSHSETDLPFLTTLYISARRDEFVEAHWPESQLIAFLSEQFTTQYHYYCQHYCTKHFDVIYYQNQPIGRLFIDRRSDEIRVVDISLLPQYRNQGIASHLFKQLFTEAQSANISVTIHVERTNPAKRLYERLGFKLKTVTDEVYLLMEWRTAAKTNS